MSSDPPDHAELVRLTAIIDLLIPAAERVDGELVDEALIAALYELHDRAQAVLQGLGVDARNSQSRSNNPQAARAANTQILAMAASRDRGEGEQAVAFFCECGCRDIIPMTVSRYEATGGAWLPGHKPQQ
jgi:hypothetical protein